MDAKASSSDECLLGGSQAEDSHSRKTWNVEGTGCSHLRGGSNLRQTLRGSCGAGRAAGAWKSSGQKEQAHGEWHKLLEADPHERPAASYDSRAELLYELLGIRVSRATICRTIKRMGYTRKKDRWVLVNY